ncbi:MAG: PilZ domain-containing protein [Acidobacteria bacterium]|nr:PilZ domain-containing protein [Acidobacteriota bacterium]
MFFQSPRKFPRVNLDVEVQADSFGRSHLLRSIEIGAGGMALKSANGLGVSQPVQLSFTLPNGQGVTVQAVVWWKRAEVIGVRFDPSDVNRVHVQRWMETQTSPVSTS